MGQGQKLVLFLLSLPFCLLARGKMVTRIAYKRHFTISWRGADRTWIERLGIQESFFILLVFFFLTIVTHTAQGAACTCDPPI